MSAIPKRPPLVPGDLMRGPRTSALGDSITIGGGTIPTRWDTNSWFTWLCLLSGGLIHGVSNRGVAGEQSGAILARVPDVIADGPERVILLAGTNDCGVLTIAQTLANIDAIVKKLRAKKIETVLCTIPPRSSSLHTEISTINFAYAQYAARNGLILIDFYTALVDENNANYRTGAGYNVDVVHPNGLGSKVMAQAAWATLQPWTRPTKVLLPAWVTESVNLITNGLFTDSNADGMSDTWQKQTPGSTTTIDSSDITIQGNWQSSSYTDLADISQSRDNSSVGHVVAFVGRVEISAVTANSSVTARVTFRDGTAGTGNTLLIIEPFSHLNQTFTGGVWYIETTIPASTRSFSVELILAGTGGTTTARFAQVGMIDLTLLGVA